MLTYADVCCSGKPSSSLLDEIGEEVATREEGEFLGEMSLLSGVARTATVILKKKKLRSKKLRCGKKI